MIGRKGGERVIPSEGQRGISDVAQAKDREGFQTWDRRGTERDFRHGTGEG